MELSVSDLVAVAAIAGAAAAVSVAAAAGTVAAVAVTVVAETGVDDGGDEAGRRGATCGGRRHMRYGI